MKARQFRAMVTRLRDRVGTPAPEVEFFHNWPKHEHLDPQQLRWFLYWRTQWESGHAQKTSLSYMMIHVYELISLEYIKEPEQAVRRLIDFYTDFRDVQPRIDVVVVRLIGDLYMKMGDVDNALYWYTQGAAGDLYEKLSWYRFGNLDIPLDVLKKVAGFTKTQYYRDRMPEIDGKVEAMMHAVFRTFYRLEGMHPLDKFARYTDESTLYLFSSTPVHEKIYVDGFRRYESAGQFVHFVKNGLRYAENLLRRAEGKSRLKCDEDVGRYFIDIEDDYPLPEAAPKERKRKSNEAAAEPERLPVLAMELPPEPIELDLSLVQSLTQETDWLVEMMQEADSTDELLVREAPVTPQPVTPTAKVGPESSTEQMLGSLFASAADGELEEFLHQISEGEQAFLRHLAASSAPLKRRALAEWLKGKRMFLDATVMQLNEAAMDAGFEPLIEDEDDTLRLSDEYESVIQAWAGQ